MRTIVDVLAQMQLWDRAMALAHMISIRWSTNDRDEAFSSIVEALGHTQAWKQAVETAQNIESDTVQSRAFSSIVEALGRTQAWKQAIEVAQNIECHTEQSNALKAVVEDMLYSQEWQPILAVIQVIKQPKQRFEALMALIESRTHVQWMSQGERTETLDSEDGLLSITAEEQFWDAIITTAQQLFEEDCRSAEMVVELLQTLAQAEQWERALKIADTPSLKEYRADILFVIALFMMHAGLDEKALALARSIDAPMRKAEAFALLAVECIHQSQLAEALLNEALAAIQIIADDEHEAFASLALQLNKAGRWQKALQIACSIRQPSERIKVLVDLARARKDTDLEQTITLLRETIAVIRDFIRTVDREDEMEVLFLIYKVNDVIAPFSALCDNIDIITHDEYKNKIQVYIKEFENMLNEEGISGILASITKKYVNTTEDEDSKNENESVLQRDEVESLAEKQQWEKMLARVWSTDASWQKTQALVYIATTLVRTGQREKGLLLLLEAEAVAHSIKEDRDRDNALVDVVDALTTIWDLDNAKVVVEFIEDVELQDGPRLLITRTLAQAQRWDEAKEEARHIGGSLKVSAMNSITDTMLLCGEYEQALQYIQTNWAQAGMRDELIKLLPLVEEFIPLYPELGEACYDAFTWVDHFLQF